MQKRLREIKRAFRRDDFSTALSHIDIVYSILYNKKVGFSRMHSGKSFAQIANEKCPHIKEWHSAFLQFESSCEHVLNTIENNYKKEDKQLINIEGEDLFLKMTRKRNHCRMFANKRCAIKYEFE